MRQALTALLALFLSAPPASRKWESPTVPLPGGGTTPPHKGGPTDFRVASFNVLGASHTAPGGNKASRPSGVARMKLAAQVIQQHKLDVIGLQEFEPSQRKAFMRNTKNQFDMYPGAHGGKADPVNSIARRKDKWDFVKGTHVTVPYFEGHKKQMPVVLLKNKETGQKAWFINVHNPASTKNHPHNEHWRDVATQKEIEIIKQLEKTGLPVIMTGDMNEKQEARQHITRGTDMKAAINGKNSHSHHVGIDWIFGSPNVHFDGYDRDASKKVQRASDHPLVYSNVHIPAAHKK